MIPTAIGENTHQKRITCAKNEAYEYVNNEKGPLHHLCALTNDIENDIRILVSQGFINLQGGKTQDNGKFAYLDTKEREGPILELAQLSDAGLGFFDMMKEAAKNWDKKTAIMDAGNIVL